MEFKVLGPLDVRRDGRAVELPGGKPRAVLAVLMLHANEPVSAERLAVALWGDDAPAGAVRTVQVYVSRLRRVLGEAELLTTSRAGYRLRVRAGELDLSRFERLVEDGRGFLAQGRPRESAELLGEALGLWRGRPLADLAFEPFAQAEIARLEEQRLAAVELRVDADLAAGRDGELVPELQRLVAEHPLRERVHGQLMLALYRSGRQADALDAYRHARDVLVESLGIEPSIKLRELERAILVQDPQLMVSMIDATEERRKASAPGTAHRPTSSIPAPPTTTVGREEELAGLETAIGDHAARLVTVVGTAGVGKTRLAVEVARTAAHDFRDGARFVSLATLDASEHVAFAIAREFELTPSAGESIDKRLVRRLANQELLLVLDNFEHVLDAAPLVAELLAAAPGVTVLATSREPLCIRAERLYKLAPLALPPEATDGDGSGQQPGPAVTLFVALAQARNPGFTGGEDMPAVMEVCRRLDGIPLALELAAGSLGLVSVTELATRLRFGLDALAPGARDAPARQRTLTATLRWSYALLSGPEQSALAALAVFAGGCGRDAAELVTGAAREVLEALVAKNLVLAEHRPDGRVRLSLLETVRQFARVRLDERLEGSAVSRRHCEYYVSLAERSGPQLEGSTSGALIARIDAELDNIRAALKWSLGHEPALALRLACALWRYWMVRSMHREAIDWLKAGLEVPDAVIPLALRATALEKCAFFLAELAGAGKEAAAAARESLDLRRSLGDLSGCAWSTAVVAYVSAHAHRVEDGYRYARQAELLARDAGDEQALVWALRYRAIFSPTLEEAISVGDQAAVAYRAAGNRRDLATLQSSLAYTALVHSDHDAARRLSVEALDAAEQLADSVVLATALGNAGLAALFNADVDAAREAFVRMLRLASGIVACEWLFEPLVGLAAVATIEGRDRIAAALVGAADAMGVQRPHPCIGRHLDEHFFAPARARLGETFWHTAYAAGAELEREQAIATALRSVGLRAVA